MADQPLHALDEAREGMLRVMTEQPNTEEPDVVKAARAMLLRIRQTANAKGQLEGLGAIEALATIESLLAARPPRSEPGDLVLVPMVERIDNVAHLVGKHLGPYLAISPAPRHEAIIRKFARSVIAEVDAQRSNPPSGQGEEVRAALDRLKNWLARGNPTGGMNLPSFEGKTPSIRADLNTLADKLDALSPSPKEGQ